MVLDNSVNSTSINSTAKIQLKILGRTFRLTSGAIVNAKKLTLCWVLSHDAKKFVDRWLFCIMA